MEVISIRSISVELATNPIINDFSLDVVQGEKVALCGESGCGKSTLLRTLIGMYQPVKGEILFNGMEMGVSQLRVIRKQLFYMPQDIIPFGDETCGEYLSYPFSLAINNDKKFIEKVVEYLFERLRLPVTLFDQPLYKLSGGERKRVGIVLGLLLKRPIMLLDEPTTGIDEMNRDAAISLLCSLSDTTMVAVTHDKALLKHFDNVIELKKSGDH